MKVRSCYLRLDQSPTVHVFVPKSSSERFFSLPTDRSSQIQRS